MEERAVEGAEGKGMFFFYFSFFFTNCLRLHVGTKNYYDGRHNYVPPRTWHPKQTTMLAPTPTEAGEGAEGRGLFFKFYLGYHRLTGNPEFAIGPSQCHPT